MTKQLTKLQESKVTTATGGLTAVGGMFLALIPSDVRSGCLDTIQSTDNPVLIGGLVCGGILLTLVGPSLSKK